LYRTSSPEISELNLRISPKKTLHFPGLRKERLIPANRGACD
jgi:hypothetical protein